MTDVKSHDWHTITCHYLQQTAAAAGEVIHSSWITGNVLKQNKTQYPHLALSPDKVTEIMEIELKQVCFLHNSHKLPTDA